MGHPELEVEGIFTHFAKSDEEDKTSANHQLELFQNFIDRIQTELGLTIPVKHCANSAAILEMPQANMDPCWYHYLRSVSFRRSEQGYCTLTGSHVSLQSYCIL